MTRVSERQAGWFKLSNTYHLDPKILQVSAGAELLFVRALALCDATQSNGRVSAEQVRVIARGMRSLRACCAELVGVLLWSYVDDVQGHCGGYVVLAYNKWVGTMPTRQEENPDQPEKSIEVRSMDRPRAGARGNARVKTDRQTDKDSIRSPSGSDRMESARAAPRDAGGATQPAPNNDGDPDTLGGLTGPEAARAAIAKGRKNNPYATGRDVQFRRTEWIPKQEPSRHEANMAAFGELLGEPGDAE